jgi:hypothetical protein
MKLPGYVDPLWVSAAKRAVRAFVVSYVGVIMAAWLGLGDTNVSGLVDAVKSHSDGAAGAGLIAAIAALGWRGLVDPLPVPTLSDANRADRTP